jgi:hypothetical protein
VRTRAAVLAADTMSRMPVDVALVGLITLGVAAVGYGAGRAWRWLGRRGWIFSGSERTAPLGSGSAIALMELDSLFSPAVEHVIEYRRHGDLWPQPGDVDGEDDDEGGRPPVPQESRERRPLA